MSRIRCSVCEVSRVIVIEVTVGQGGVVRIIVVNQETIEVGKRDFAVECGIAIHGACDRHLLQGAGVFIAPSQNTIRTADCCRPNGSAGELRGVGVAGFHDRLDRGVRIGGAIGVAKNDIAGLDVCRKMVKGMFVSARASSNVPPLTIIAVCVYSMRH